MTTAIQSDPSRIDAPRRRPQEDAPSKHPVLIRLPNLEPRQDDLPASGNKTPADQQKFAQNEAAPVDQAPPRHGDQEVAVPPTSAPMWAARSASWVSPQVMGWVWKLVIVGAAIGLVVLAYKIINGPGELIAPADVDLATPADNTPGALPQIQDATAPAIQPLAPAAQGASNPAPATNYVDQKGYQDTSFDPHAPSGRNDMHNHNTSAAPSRVPLSPSDATLPIGPAEDRPGAWDSESPAVERNPNMPSRPWSESAGDQDAAARPWATPGEQRPGQSSNAWSQETYNYPNTTGGNDRPAADGPTSPYPQTDSHNYPETNSDTWRDNPGGNRALPNDPGQRGAALPGDWMQDSRSAQRELRPGVARLRGEIEQPPLR